MNLNEWINKNLNSTQLGVINCDKKETVFNCGRGLGRTYTCVCKILRDKPKRVVWVDGYSSASVVKSNIESKLREIIEKINKDNVDEDIEISYNGNNNIIIKITSYEVDYRIDTDDNFYDLAIFENSLPIEKYKYNKCLSTVTQNRNNYNPLGGKVYWTFDYGIYKGILDGLVSIKYYKDIYKECDDCTFSREFDILNEAQYLGIKDVVQIEKCDEREFLKQYAKYNCDKSILFVTSSGRGEYIKNCFLESIKSFISDNEMTITSSRNELRIQYRDGGRLNLRIVNSSNNLEGARGIRLNRVVYDRVKLSRDVVDGIIRPCGLVGDFSETYIKGRDNLGDILFEKEQVEILDIDSRKNWAKKEMLKLMREYSLVNDNCRSNNTIYREEILKQINYLKDLETYYK